MGRERATAFVKIMTEGIVFLLLVGLIFWGFGKLSLKIHGWFFDLWGIMFPGPRPKASPQKMINEPYEELYSEGRTLGTLVLGRPGSGKTSFLARQVLLEFFNEPDHTIFVFDMSGSVTDMILTILAQIPPEKREEFEKRIVYDELGNRNWAVPMPEFSEEYGSLDEQCQRVSWNMGKLAPHLITGAPIMGGLAIATFATNLFRILCSITNDYGDTWQLTEAKRLVWDEALLKKAINKYAHKFPEAKYYFEKVFLPASATEKERLTYAPLSLLNAIEPKEVRARLGFYQPGWTPKEAIQKGMMVIINGSPLINQPLSQHYLFTQAYSILMQTINTRIPGDPRNSPVSIVLDEVYALIGIPGMAEEVGKISPLYRNRKVQLYVVLQSLSQLAKPLDKQIWSLGNKVIFATEDKEESEMVGRQLFGYDPSQPRPDGEGQTSRFMETEGGQDRIYADWIQNLNFRECLIRRYYSEKEVDPIIRHISQTKELSQKPLLISVPELKDRLLRKRAVSIREALDTINRRSINSTPPSVP